MKISCQWLVELTGVDWPVREMAHRLTLCGLCCEDVVATDRYLENVVVGEVVDLKPIKGADKIKLATVNVGTATHDLVCGAPNVAVGQKAPTALLGARLAGDIEIKRVKIRGVESCGMVCSERELGFSDDHSGIMVLDNAAPVGTPLADYLEYRDYVLDIELTPNRGDAMSAIGIARDLAALAGVRVKYPSYAIKPNNAKASDVFSVTSDDPDACPRFTARIIRNVKIAPSPWWVQKRLLTCGVRPISNVVDITNYIMIETGNPIHAFDLDRFGSSQVVVRRARSGERLVTLDGKEHTLTPEVLLITNGREAKAAAGVMGGFDSEVKDDTRNLLLEVACFNPKTIRAGRKKLGFVSEASSRFERGVDPNNVPVASARAVYLFQELCGGEVLDGLLDFYPHPVKPRAVELRPQRCNDILGTQIKSERMTEILSRLEFEVTSSEPSICVNVPTFRGDITREIDLIEEIGRIEGYDTIPNATENRGPMFAPANRIEGFWNEIRTVLTGAGFDEILGHGLGDSRLARLLNPDLPQLRILNPVSEDFDIMRNDLVSTVLGVIAHNIAHRHTDLRLFEIGKVYRPPDQSGNWVEEDRLLLAVTGNTLGNWQDKPRPVGFYDLSGGLQQLARHFHWPLLNFGPCDQPYLEPDQSFSVGLNGTSVGSAGLIKPELARKGDIKQPVFVLQVKLAPLFELSHKLAELAPLPVFPAATRDLAIVVNETTRSEELVATIRSEAGALAESVEVFDVYTGAQIGQGRKSIAIGIVYRAPDRSLSSEEVDKLQQNIISRLIKNFNAEIRDK
jgi:phenylalanyl-tRNA synthetase beta chain